MVETTEDPADRTVEAKLLALRIMALKDLGKKWPLFPALGEQACKPPSFMINPKLSLLS